MVGKTNSFVKDSSTWVEEISKEKLNNEDKLVSFDVVSLYTKIPIDEAINTIKELTNTETAKLVEVCLRSTYFTFQNEFYEQVEGVAMGSPLSPIVANLYMERFERQAIESFPLKPKIWKCYVDDTDVVWPHGEDNLAKFLEHLNKQNNSIRFTMELETKNSLPFLDVLISKREDGSIAHQVFRKKTHTKKYLHANSLHFPLKSLVSSPP